jgi:hypothetical protein
MSHWSFFRVVFVIALITLGSACQPSTAQPPTATVVAAPAVVRDFRSTSGQTFIQYYIYTSGTCGSGSNCNFRGIIRPPAGYDQVEVFLTGFTLETHASEDKVQRISAEVHKYRHDPATGELEVGVTGRLDTETRQPYSYQISFVVLLTNAAAMFTRVGNSCSGAAQCHITASLVGAVPQPMHYIGLGTRILDLGSSSGPISINTLSGHLDFVNTQNPPDVQVDYLCEMHDASVAGRMFCEWDASVIAFDPAEMDRNDSPIWPYYTMINLNVSHAQQLNGQAKPFSGGTISGFLDALEGLTFNYDPGQQNAIWLVDTSAANFQIVGSPPTTATTQYGIFLGTTFGNRANAQPFSFQESRAIGLLR